MQIKFVGHMKILRSLAVYLILILMVLLSLLPLCVHHFFANILAFILHKVVKYRVKVVNLNLTKAFPDLSPDEIQHISKDYYLHIADIFCEVIWSLTRPYSYIKKKGVFTVEGDQQLAEAFEKYGNLMVMLGHCGNWELFIGFPIYCDNAHFDYSQVFTAYHPMNSRFSEELFKKMRCFHQVTEENLLPSKNILRQVLSHRDEPRIYFFIADQCSGGKGQVETNFLGLQTKWLAGAEAVAGKVGMPVAYVGIDKIGRSRYVARCEMLTEGPSDCPLGDITTAFTKRLERDIQANKVNWLWSHKRWKNILNYKNVNK